MPRELAERSLIVAAFEWSRSTRSVPRSLGACSLYAPPASCSPPPNRSTHSPDRRDRRLRLASLSPLDADDPPHARPRRFRRRRGDRRRTRAHSRAAARRLDGDAPLARMARRGSRRASPVATPHVLWLVVVTAAQRRTTSRSRRGAPTVGRRASRRSSRDAPTSSTATPRRLRATRLRLSGDHDCSTHARWVEILGRDALSIRFFRALERALDALATSSDQRLTERATRDRAARVVAPALPLLSRGEGLARRRSARSSRIDSTRAWRAAAAFTSACCGRSSSER